MITFVYVTVFAKRRVYLQCYAGGTCTLNELRSYLDQQAKSASWNTDCVFYL